MKRKISIFSILLFLFVMLAAVPVSAEGKASFVVELQPLTYYTNLNPANEIKKQVSKIKLENGTLVDISTENVVVECPYDPHVNGAGDYSFRISIKDGAYPEYEIAPYQGMITVTKGKPSLTFTGPSLSYKGSAYEAKDFVNLVHLYREGLNANPFVLKEDEYTVTFDDDVEAIYPGDYDVCVTLTETAKKKYANFFEFSDEPVRVTIGRGLHNATAELYLLEDVDPIVYDGKNHQILELIKGKIGYSIDGGKTITPLAQEYYNLDVIGGNADDSVRNVGEYTKYIQMNQEIRVGEYSSIRANTRLLNISVKITEREVTVKAEGRKDLPYDEKRHDVYDFYTSVTVDGLIAEDNVTLSSTKVKYPDETSVTLYLEGWRKSNYKFQEIVLPVTIKRGTITEEEVIQDVQKHVFKGPYKFRYNGKPMSPADVLNKMIDPDELNVTPISITKDDTLVPSANDVGEYSLQTEVALTEEQAKLLTIVDANGKEIEKVLFSVPFEILSNQGTLMAEPLVQNFDVGGRPDAADCVTNVQIELQTMDSQGKFETLDLSEDDYEAEWVEGTPEAFEPGKEYELVVSVKDQSDNWRVVPSKVTVKAGKWKAYIKGTIKDLIYDAGERDAAEFIESLTLESGSQVILENALHADGAEVEISYVENTRTDYGAGEYKIQAAMSYGDYVIEPVILTGQILPLERTVKIEGELQKIWGEEDPAVVYHIYQGETLAEDESEVTFFREEGESVGEYAYITMSINGETAADGSGITLGNYQYIFDANDVNLIISPADAVLQAVLKEKVVVGKDVLEKVELKIGDETVVLTEGVDYKVSFEDEDGTVYTKIPAAGKYKMRIELLSSSKYYGNVSDNAHKLEKTLQIKKTTVKKEPSTTEKTVCDEKAVCDYKAVYDYKTVYDYKGYQSGYGRYGKYRTVSWTYVWSTADDFCVEKASKIDEIRVFEKFYFRRPFWFS